MRTRVEPGTQAGFALILAILALLLLTFLGLTLATTTSTELQIATNYRWSQQAYYNAEAGIEVAKIVLRNVPTNWNSILPAPRSVVGGWPPGSAPKCATGANGCTTPSPGATRNWEGDVPPSDCDTRYGTGYGAVLDPDAAGGAPPLENITTANSPFPGLAINGAFTLWVRRDVQAVPGTQNLQDSTDNSTLVLISEGVAPTPSNVPGALQQAGRAVRVLQVRLSRAQQAAGCQAAEGQAGTTASGGNFGACAPLTNVAGLGAGSGADLGVK